MTEQELTNEKNLDAAVENATEAAEAPETPVKESAADAAEEIKDEAPKEETPKEEPKETPTAEKEVKTAPPVDNVPHDEFPWDAEDEDDMILSAPKDGDELGSLYESTFKEISENEIIPGLVEVITDSDVVLNIGFKSDGLVSLSEFRDTPDLKIGDEVQVYVEEREDAKGQLVLSRRKAKLLQAWEAIVEAHNTDKIVKGTIISKTKGGLITDVFGLETFLPGSQIDVKSITDYDAYVGKTMEFKIVKINEQIKNAVVSHKALIESDLEAQRLEIISTLEKGQVLEGTIKNLTDFGAFIDLGGVDGLLYITDISWGRINHPNEVLEINQTLNVVVLDFDDEKKRISLGLKQLAAHPWDVLSADLAVGSAVKGKVVNIEDYGAFLEITPGVEGLIHVSEISWSNQPINSREFFKLKDEYEAKVVTLDRDERKMSLSIKQLTADPWEGIAGKFPIESKHSGVVKNITPYGVFVELSDGIGGMVHISDLSWTKRYNHPNDFTKVGETLEIVVLEIDEEGRKLSLGHKQIEEDPWDTFESIFPVGSQHQGTIIKKDDKGGVVSLPYGIEAFAPNKHLKKEDGKFAALEEVLEFKVIDFDRNDKKIVISHTRIHDETVTDTKRKSSPKGDGQKRPSKRGTANLSKKMEKTTLGDLDVLSQLKSDLLAEEKGGTPAPVEKVDAEPKAKSEEEE